MEVTDEEADKITRETAQAKVTIRSREFRESSRKFLGSKNGCRESNSSCKRN